jgi:hypothetical protein
MQLKADNFDARSPSVRFAKAEICLTELRVSGQRRLAAGGAIGFWILDLRFWILRNEGAGAGRVGTDNAANADRSGTRARVRSGWRQTNTAKQEVPDRTWRSGQRQLSVGGAISFLLTPVASSEALGTGE